MMVQISGRRFVASVFLVAFLLLSADRSRAQSATTGDEKPYDVFVCLKFEEAPRLTKLFAEMLVRQTRGQLAGYFGPLADVGVVAEEHWLLEELNAHELEDDFLSPALLRERPLPEKTFLMVVGHRDGKYVVRWRQIDGRRYHIGPVRERWTPDRPWVAKAICLAVRDDFSPVAEIEPIAGSDRVRVKFRGGQWKDRLAGWVDGDCVLKPYTLIRDREGTLRREPIPHTYLRIIPGEASLARVVSNQSDPLARSARVAGFEAVKLNTREGTLRLRVVDWRTRRPALNSIVYAGDRGFRQLSEEDSLGDTDSRGWVTSGRTFDHLAYVRIAQGGGSILLPVPITERVCELECGVRTDPQSSEKTAWRRELRFLAQDVQILETMLADAVHEANDLNAAKRYEDGLARVRDSLNAVAPLRDQAREQHASLVAEAQPLELTADAMLAWVDERMRQLADKEKNLGRLAAGFEANIQKRDAQSRADTEIEFGVQFEAEGDGEEAIARYEAALRQQPDQPQLEERLARLKEAWRIKGAEHQAARDYVFEQWPAARVDQIEAALPEARKAQDALEAAGDFLTARKLMKLTGEKIGDLTELIEILAASDLEKDRTNHEEYVALIQQVVALHDRIGDYVARESGARPRPGAAEPLTPAPKPTEEEELEVEE